MWVHLAIVVGGCLAALGFLLIAIWERAKNKKNTMGMIVVGAFSFALFLAQIVVVLIERR
jgi:hypothetical protein